jgi:hypothetical protein
MKSARSYLKPFTIALLLFLGIFAIAWISEAFVYQIVVLRYIILLFPLIPLIFAASYFSKAIGALDELQQRIQIEALAFSLGGLLLIGIAVGLLELAGLPEPNWIWVTVLGFVLWGVGQWVAARRYR